MLEGTTIAEGPGLPADWQTNLTHDTAAGGGPDDLSPAFGADAEAADTDGPGPVGHAA